VTAKIYVEGGGDNRDTIVRCKGGFAEYCKKICPQNRRPAIVACGSRKEAFDRFKIAVETSKPGEQPALLVDSEGPVDANAAPAAYLHERDRWDFSRLPKDRVFLMVQAMEAWFMADRNALAEYYGEGFKLRALPFDELHIESIPKNDLEPALVNATRATKTKGEYHKTRHAFALLVAIDPTKVERGSPHAEAFNNFLRTL
jgi:hypothetical protein